MQLTRAAAKVTRHCVSNTACAPVRVQRAMHVSASAAPPFGNASIQEAALALKAGTHKYLDVRTDAEFAAGHVPGATHAAVWVAGPGGMTPNAAFVQQVEALLPNKDTLLMVGCKSGRRSLAACEVLSAAGYSGLTNVLGGWDEWAAAGGPVEK